MTEKNKISILVVDDEKSARELMVDCLEESGFVVTAKDSGIRALETLKISSFDIIISDLLMPEMSGIALTKEIKNMGIDTPIIVITGLGTIEYAVESMQAGAVDFVTKPLSIDHINITVQKALETKKLQKEAGQTEYYKKLSNCDGLTDIANHRYFKEILAQEIKRAVRYSRTLSLMMLDIDDFKACNDKYGHPAGDAVLKQVATQIKKNTRGIDVAARYGGEEFSVILPETPIEEALVVAERIRSAIDLYRFKTEENNDIYHITVTIGLASFPDQAEDLKDLINKSDKALYQGKTSGKNRVVLFNKE